MSIKFESPGSEKEEDVVGPEEAWPDEKAMARAESMVDSFGQLREEQNELRKTLPPAAKFNRLPKSWYKAKAEEIKEQARERGIDGGVLLTNRWNIIYATGLLHTTTERPFACFLPIDKEDAIIWLHPYLDDSLVRDWWSTENYSYFDYQHAEGGDASRGNVKQGDTVNIFSWWGETLSNLGYGNKTIGVDSGKLAEIGILPGQEQSERLNMRNEKSTPEKYRPQNGSLGLMAEEMPEAQFIDVYDILINQRIVKDEKESHLTQRAMDYFSEIHAFARNYLLERGKGILDWEIANAARVWGMHRIMQDISSSGKPHEAVGIEVRLSCRAGRATAYPHPNQAYWTRIKGGHALQLAGIVRLGGYGGELYRSFLIAPWTDWQEHVWDVHTKSYFIQAKESYSGNTCSNVAKAVHDYQIEHGCKHLIYHRPGHGMGMEGHQPPYQALGDYTVMKKGMHFSNEPGLFDPKSGFGYNHGNTILVDEEKGLQMGTVPADKDWCLLDL